MKQYLSNWDINFFETCKKVQTRQQHLINVQSFAMKKDRSNKLYVMLIGAAEMGLKAAQAPAKTTAPTSKHDMMRVHLQYAYVLESRFAARP